MWFMFFTLFLTLLFLVLAVKSTKVVGVLLFTVLASGFAGLTLEKLGQF